MKIDKEPIISSEDKPYKRAEQPEQTLLSEFRNIFPEEKMIEIMKANLQERVLSKDLSSEFAAELLEDDLPDAISREKEFAQEIIRAFSRWSKEISPIVLWDIDDTMGKINLNQENMQFLFRPTFLPLLKFLKEKFPQIKNGVLSNRVNVLEQLQDEKQLKAIAPLIDKQYIYSCRNIEVSPDEAEKYETEAEQSELAVNQDYLSKRKIIDNLLKDGLLIKCIDDNDVAAIIGQDGVCVYLIMPNRVFCGKENG